MFRRPNKPFIVIPYQEALEFLAHVEKSDPMLWNHRLRVTYKKYGASISLQLDGSTASDPAIVARYMKLWAELFPHNMTDLRVGRWMYRRVAMWVAPNLPDVVAEPIYEWICHTYLMGRVSIVYQEYMELVG